MAYKMDLAVTITPSFDATTLRAELEEHGAKVVEYGDKVVVRSTIDIREGHIEYIMNACHACGECSVEAHQVKE